MIYTGIDYHKVFSYLIAMSYKGEIIGQKKLPSNRWIVDYIKDFVEEKGVAIEATPSWYRLYDQKKDERFQVKLSHPLKSEALAYVKVKTDVVDSATLAHLLMSNLLPLSYMPERPARLN